MGDVTKWGTWKPPCRCPTFAGVLFAMISIWFQHFVVVVVALAVFVVVVVIWGLNGKRGRNMLDYWTIVFTLGVGLQVQRGVKVLNGNPWAMSLIDNRYFEQFPCLNIPRISACHPSFPFTRQSRVVTIPFHPPPTPPYTLDSPQLRPTAIGG